MLKSRFLGAMWVFYLQWLEKSNESVSIITCSTPCVNVREDYHDNTNNTDNHTTYLHQSVFCFQENPSQYQNARDRPAVQ